MKMKNLKLIACILALMPAFSVNAQVTFVVENLPATTPPADNLYIAGDFTGWDPGAAAYVMHKNEQDKWTITLPERPEGTVLKYKFTRGSWQTVEKGCCRGGDRRSHIHLTETAQPFRLPF
jgi:hypothetical protein